MLVPLVLIGGLAYYIYNRASNLADKIVFTPVAVSFKDATLTLKVFNPTDTEATIKGVSGYILANKNRVGSYVIANAFKIPANGSVNLLVKLKLDAAAVLNQVSKLLIEGKTPKISISGKIKTAVASVDFENDLVDSVSLKKK